MEEEERKGLGRGREFIFYMSGRSSPDFPHIPGKKKKKAKLRKIIISSNPYLTWSLSAENTENLEIGWNDCVAKSTLEI